jgi:hypothetical protein
MASMGKHYQAKGSRAECVEDTETASPAQLISKLVFVFLGVTGRKRPGDILYSGDQFDAGEEVDRIALAELFMEELPF